MECSRCGDFVLYDLSDNTEEVLCDNCREERGKYTGQVGTEVKMDLQLDAEYGASSGASSGDSSLTQAQRAQLAALTIEHQYAFCVDKPLHEHGTVWPSDSLSAEERSRSDADRAQYCTSCWSGIRDEEKESKS